MPTKNEQLLAYLAKKHEKATVTVLMKICYLIDLVGEKKYGRQISEYRYKRYTYGPFDQKIYRDLSELQSKGILIAKSDYTASGEEYIHYSLNEETESVIFDKLLGAETQIIDEVLESVKGFGARTLTEIAYKTKPMKALNATLGGNENMSMSLDLKTK
ncbi:MAG: Panacea domain-containing protein [Candidatus Paceibacterota bacterium]|jgi:uncharacterized protein YwgA